VTPDTTIAFKIMIQENHLGPYRMYALGTANLESLISSNSIREVKVFKIDGDKDKSKAEPSVIKVRVFKVGETPDWKPFTPKMVYPKITKEAWVDVDIERKSINENERSTFNI
jgi:hypothetical protein